MHLPLEPTEHELFPTAQKELLPTYLFCRTKIPFPTCVKTNVLHSFSLPPSKVSRSFGRSVGKLPSALTPSQQVRCSEKGEHFPGSFQYLLPTEVRRSVDNNDDSGGSEEGGERRIHACNDLCRNEKSTWYNTCDSTSYFHKWRTIF